SGDGVGTGSGRLGGFRRDGVPDIEEHFEKQLFALIGRVQIRHPKVVLGGARAVIGFAVDGLEVRENPVAGPGGHAKKTTTVTEGRKLPSVLPSLHQSAAAPGHSAPWE